MGSKGDQWSNAPPGRATQISFQTREVAIKTDVAQTATILTYKQFSRQEGPEAWQIIST